MAMNFNGKVYLTLEEQVQLNSERLDLIDFTTVDGQITQLKNRMTAVEDKFPEEPVEHNIAVFNDEGGLADSGVSIDSLDFVEKTDEVSKIYGTDGNGDPKLYATSVAGDAGAVALYRSTGNLATGTPTVNGEAANKQYVDSRVIANNTTGTYGGWLSSLKVGNNYYFIHDYPCLIEGTLITMADGTKKAIEEVKAGDMVMAYDPLNKTKIRTVVIAAYKTGENTNFTAYQFEDGNRLITYGIHKYYNPERGCASQLPKEDGFIAINENLEEVECVGVRFYPTFTKKTARYNIITNANSYFADGILCAHGPQDKYLYFVNRKLEDKLPDEVKEILKTDAEEAQKVFEKSGDPTFLKTLCPKIKECRVKKRAIEQEKKELNEARQTKDNKKTEELEARIEADTKAYDASYMLVKEIRSTIPKRSEAFQTSVQNSKYTTQTLYNFFNKSEKSEEK